MTGAELKQIRQHLGDALGVRLSLADMARICGLSPGNGADKMRQWEEGDGPTGPVAAVASLLAYASVEHSLPAEMTSAVDGWYAEEWFQKMMLAEVRRRLS